MILVIKKEEEEKKKQVEIRFRLSSHREYITCTKNYTSETAWSSLENWIS